MKKQCFHKRAVLCLIIAILLLSCVSCKSENGLSDTTDAFYTFTDSEGNEVVLPEKPQKVAVCFSSLADMYVNAGGEIYISVGESVERGFVSEDTLLVDGGAGKKIDNELLISYEPDLVIYSADIAAHKESYAIIKEADIPAACFRVDNFDDYMYVFEIMCNITENDESFIKYGTDVQKRIEDIIIDNGANISAPLDILYIRCGSGASSTKAKNSDDNFVCEMLKELGTHNIADDAVILLDGLSLETIIEANPDYIFFSTMGDRDAAIAYMESVLSEPGWSSLDAIKNNNYDFLPKDLFQYKPNANWDKSYEYLIGLLNNVQK